MKYFKIVIFFLFITQISIAQNSNRIFKNVKQTENGLEIRTDQTTIEEAVEQVFNYIQDKILING